MLVRRYLTLSLELSERELNNWVMPGSGTIRAHTPVTLTVWLLIDWHYIMQWLRRLGGGIVLKNFSVYCHFGGLPSLHFS